MRFVIEQYRDELITSLQGTVDEERRNEDREEVARDLLNILYSIPIQSIATNGPSLVRQQTLNKIHGGADICVGP